MAKKLSSAATFLDSHSKRDKVIRTVQFGALLVGGLSKNRWPLVSQKLLKVYNEFGHARLILRMIDDVPMLAHTLRCCFSREKSDNFLRWSTFASNLCCQIFYPLEHFAWLADSKLMPFSSDKLWKCALLCWVMYSIIQIIQCLHKLRMMHSYSSEQKLHKQKLSMLFLGMLQYICDLLCGLHWMNWGPLSDKLSDSLLGLLGTTSSIVQLHRSLN